MAYALTQNESEDSILQSAGVKEAVSAAVEWSLAHGIGFKAEAHTVRQVPFSFSPSVVHRSDFERLSESASVLGRLIHGVSQDEAFLTQAIAPVAKGDLFFQGLLRMYRRIRSDLKPFRSLPVLIMRSDFMEDGNLGHQLVEFNGIAAGMGPFGARAHHLHRYLQQFSPELFSRWSEPHSGALVNNPALARLGLGIAQAATKIRAESGQSGRPVMLMVIQEGEDNVYDQRLLELELLKRGVDTVRRTFRQLYGSLSTGAERRLLLDEVGGIDFVYLRAGYHYRDYVANDIRHEPCCEALAKTRVFLERHRVAINATVAQQLATSKRVQLLIGQMSAQQLTRFGVTLPQAELVAPLLKSSHPLSPYTLDQIRDLNDWVLKNQGEGGGHCLFGRAIETTLTALEPSEYPVWQLMQRLIPPKRQVPALLVRNGRAQIETDLVSELGLFSVHIDGAEAFGASGYAGYLVRSKPASAAEGGVHSGLGALDSLAFK